MKFLFGIFICILFSISLPSASIAQSQSSKAAPVDKIVILMETPESGVMSVKTTVIDFESAPTDITECKRLAEEYDDFTKLSGVVFCYFRGKYLIKYKI